MISPQEECAGSGARAALLSVPQSWQSRGVFQCIRDWRTFEWISYTKGTVSPASQNPNCDITTVGTALHTRQLPPLVPPEGMLCGSLAVFPLFPSESLRLPGYMSYGNPLPYSRRSWCQAEVLHGSLPLHCIAWYTYANKVPCQRTASHGIDQSKI